MAVGAMGCDSGDVAPTDMAADAALEATEVKFLGVLSFALSSDTDSEFECSALDSRILARCICEGIGAGFMDSVFAYATLCWVRSCPGDHVCSPMCRANGSLMLASLCLNLFTFLARLACANWCLLL